MIQGMAGDLYITGICVCVCVGGGGGGMNVHCKLMHYIPTITFLPTASSPVYKSPAIPCIILQLINVLD